MSVTDPQLKTINFIQHRTEVELPNQDDYVGVEIL